MIDRGQAWRGRNDLWFTPRGLGAAGGRLAFVFPGIEVAPPPESRSAGFTALAIAWPLVATRPSFVLRSYTIDPRVSVATIAIGCLLSLGSAYLGAIVAGGRALRSPTRDLLAGPPDNKGYLGPAY